MNTYWEFDSYVKPQCDLIFICITSTYLLLYYTTSYYEFIYNIQYFFLFISYYTEYGGRPW